MSNKLQRNDNGTVRFVLDDKPFVLRRVNLGELQDLKEAWNGYVAKSRQSRRDRSDELQSDGLSKAEADLQARAEGDDGPLVTEWILDVFRRLVDNFDELPPKEQLPAWFENPTLPNTLIEHWSELPSQSGA